MPSGPETVVIADDLTGAADTGVQFATLGAPVYLLPLETLGLDRPWMSEAAGISLYTSSRQLLAEAAERLRRVAPALADLRPQWIYKKIDSCLRGNPGAEIDVLLDSLGLDAALIAPALPAQGRITVGGIHLVRGVPLAETEFAKDPFTPIASSSVAEILGGQSRYPVGAVHVDDYDDPDRLKTAVQRERGGGCRLIVCDAAEQAHLDQLAGLVVRSAGRLLPVGSAGLAASLAGQLFAGPVVAPLSVPAVERLLLVCGTGSRVTRGQLDILFDRHSGMRAELEPEWLIAASPDDRQRRVGELLDTWTGGILALSIGPLPSEGSVVTPAQGAAGLAGLAGLASEIVRAGRADGIFLTGGETADAFLRASGGEAIALEQDLLPGLVLGRMLGGPANGLPVVTKAGAFGGKRTLVALYERISAVVKGTAEGQSGRAG